MEGLMKPTRLKAVGGLVVAASLFLLAGCPAKPGLTSEAIGELDGAQIQFGNRNYAAAAASCSRYIQKYPDSPVAAEAYYLRGLCQMYLHQGAAAGVDLKLAADQAGNDAELRFKSRLAIAHVAYELGRYSEAAAAYGELLEQADPILQPELLFRHGMSLNATERGQEGAKVFRRLLSEYAPSAAADRLREQVRQPASGGAEGTGSFAVQIGAFGNPANAQQAVAQLAARGYKPLIQTRVKAGRSLHAVLVGWFATAAQGEQVRQALRPAYPGAILVTR
jgi:tetratricopeptide (TPR) repeat protein